MALTESQKIRFINNLPNETYLRDQLLVPLFRNMNKFKVVSMHGATEGGKDIVLVSKNNFGLNQYTAVIAKNEAVTNAATKRDKEIVANVSNQIVMCLNSGYDSVEEKRKVHFSEILVVTSQKLSNTARAELVNVAERNQFNNLIFWEDAELVRNVDEFLPEIYLVGSGSLSKYFHVLKQRCERLNELKKISIYKGDARRLAEVYIEPKLYRKVKQVENGKTVAVYKESAFSKLVAKQGRFLLVGSAGSGKSTLFRSEVNRTLVDYESKKSSRIPIFIKIYYLLKNGKDLPPIQKVRKYLAEEYELQDSDVEEVFSAAHHLVFFFDGYDELSSEEDQAAFRAVIDAVESTYSCTVIVSTRRGDYLTEEHFKSYEEWKLSDFSVLQIRQFFEKWFNNSRIGLLQDLTDHDLLDKLPNTPLVMTLIAILFDSDENVEIPSNLAELYRMFIDLLIGRWNLDRKVDSFYKANDKETYLTDLAVYLQTARKISCTKAELQEVFSSTTRKLGRKIDEGMMLDELVKDTNLVLANEKGEYEYRHLSFQEYFVASHLAVKNQIQPVVSAFPDPWWDQVLYYYCGIRKENEDVLPAIFDRIAPLEPRKRLMALFHFGYLIQSSYRTHSDVRKTLLLKAIAAFATTLPDYVSSAEELKKLPEIIRYLSLVEIFKIHYKSKFLVEIFGDALSELKKIDTTKFPQALALFVHSSIMSSSGDVDALVQNEAAFKDHPIIVLMEDFYLRSELLEDAQTSQDRQKIKGIAKTIAKRIRNNPQLYRNVLDR